MWIRHMDWMAMTAAVSTGLASRQEVGALHGQLTTVLADNARLRADLDWFKLRLNQVEKERGQLIQAAIGVKISVPAFVSGVEDPERALHEMPDFAQVGQDAANEADYSGLPTRAVNNR